MKIDTMLKEDKVFSKNELTNMKVDAFSEYDKQIRKLYDGYLQVIVNFSLYYYMFQFF